MRAARSRNNWTALPSASSCAYSPARSLRRWLFSSKRFLQMCPWARSYSSGRHSRSHPSSASSGYEGSFQADSRQGVHSITCCDQHSARQPCLRPSPRLPACHSRRQPCWVTSLRFHGNCRRPHPFGTGNGLAGRRSHLGHSRRVGTRLAGTWSSNGRRHTSSRLRLRSS